MYLKALEIQGFKSFPDKTVLSFHEDITAIVGPNGSGKSNISDAIRWVMGEQSTRALRGGKMEDVIFGGTATRKQTGFAEVSLVLDNTLRIFDREDSEVMVTRRYYRSGESEYYINRRSVRLKDLNELFMDTGLGREGYSIIGQGKIDEILSIKSADRREVFEEAAGISRFRHRKEESERKLQRTEENLLRVSDKISELELQVEPLREQSEKAKKFLILRDELKSLEISVWLDSLERLRAGTIKLSADYEEAARQQVQAKQALEGFYADVETFSQQMREKEMEIDALRQQRQEEESAASELEAAVTVLRGSIQNNLDNAQRIRADLEQREDREGGLAAQIAQRRTQLEGLEAREQTLRTELAEISDQSHALRQSHGDAAQQLETLRQQQATETATAGEARALLSALAAAAQELLDRDEAVRQQLHEMEQRLGAAQAEQRAAQTAHNEAQTERDAAYNVISGYTLRLQARQKKADEAKERHMKLRMDSGALESRVKLLQEMEKEYEGFHKAVKLVMEQSARGNLRGIHGPVASLLTAADSYTVAIETALGGAMQHLVVDSEENGKTVIQYLKRRDGGRCTILPLSSVRPADLRERQAIARVPGFVGVGDELVEFDPQYRTIVSSLLGRVVVMEHLDAAIAAARQFGYRFRIVTLDGQVLNPGGSMTGGSVSRSAGILSRKGELERLEQQARQLDGQLQQVQQDLTQFQREAAAAQYELETAQAQLRQWEDALLKTEGNCARCADVIAALTSQKTGYEEELDQLTQRNTRIEQDTAAARARIAALEGTAATLEEQATERVKGQTELQQRLAALTEQSAALAATLTGLQAERETAAESLVQLESLRRDMESDRAQNRTLAERYEEKNQSMERDIAQKTLLLNDCRAKIHAHKEGVQRLGDEKLALEGRRNQADRQSREKNQELLAMEREVSVLEQKKVTAAMEEKQLLDKLWDSYELSHEAAKALRVELESLPKANRRIGELRRGISALGSINVGAIEEYQRVYERYSYLTDQRDDVAKAKKELEEIIAGITQEMKTIFAREFETINTAFGQTFAELFGGGKATLELEDPDDILNCGIEIRVQPPGKALKIITLLSGGEKAFVAIALYFAILKVRPTPFVVMDEIEAALDDNNVTRFARYLRSMADKTQFIVITHRRGTMEDADVLYGVTMQEQGISRMLTINLNDVEKQLNIK